MSPASKKISLFVEDSPQKYAAPAEPCCFCSVPGVLTSEQRRRGDRRGSKVRHPGRRFSQMSISPLNPLFSWGHPLFTCWLCGCVLRLQTRSSRGLSPVSWLLLALQTPSKGDTCAARLCFFFCEGWESILELEEFWPAAPGSWKLPLCLLLSACKNNDLFFLSGELTLRENSRGSFS